MALKMIPKLHTQSYLTKVPGCFLNIFLIFKLILRHHAGENQPKYRTKCRNRIYF